MTPTLIEELKLAAAKEIISDGARYIPVNPSHLLSLISALELERRRAEGLVEALEFYGDEDNWSESGTQVCPAMIVGEDIENRKSNQNKFTGGKVARAALAAYREGEKK